MSSSSSASSSSQQPGCIVDPLDSLLDFSEYENVSYQSPSISPSASSKLQLSRPVSAAPATLPSTQQPLTGPSHQYELYRQQTGIPVGAVASTLAINSNNAELNNFTYGMEYLTGLSPNDDFIDFGAGPSQTPFTEDMDFESAGADSAFFFDRAQASSSFVNPSALNGQEQQTIPSPAVLPTQANVGRVWPGMHQQAALAKAQAQQRQQQMIIQQQRQNAQAKTQRKVNQPAADPIVEEKISQLLNNMRSQSVAGSDISNGSNPMVHLPKAKKDEEDMDEDERLLASEEGKKLSSKERRQLRNKVSARAFRSRRKEYIGQLEGEIASKLTENHDLRAQNRALIEENQRLSDLTRMLLSSPSFSDFLNTLSANPTLLPQAQQAPAPAVQPQAPVETQQQLNKDTNPMSILRQQRISMAIMPEQNIDFNMLNMNTENGFTYQPQVYAVLETPEAPIDTSILSGKSSNFVGEQLDSDSEKVQIPVIERMPVQEEKMTPTVSKVDEEFDSDPAVALFSDSESATSESELDLFAGVQPEKVFARLELVDASEEEANAAAAMGRVHRILSSLDGVMARLEALTTDL